MAPIRADYRVIADDWVTEHDRRTINFDIPDSAHPEQRSVLSFMFLARALDPYEMSLEINGIRIWTYTSGDDYDGIGPLCMQEVIGRDIFRVGRNILRFAGSGGTRFVKFSDIVLWYQA